MRMRQSFYYPYNGVGYARVHDIKDLIPARGMDLWTHDSGKISEISNEPNIFDETKAFRFDIIILRFQEQPIYKLFTVITNSKSLRLVQLTVSSVH